VISLIFVSPPFGKQRTSFIKGWINIERDAQEIYLTVFLLIRMWQADGFKCLSPRRVISGELRSIVTWFMFLLMIAQASWGM
jgi:hypothetical protein